MTKTAVIAMIVFGCTSWVLAEDAVVPPAPPAATAPAVEPAPKDVPVYVTMIAWRHYKFWRMLEGEDKETSEESEWCLGGNPYGRNHSNMLPGRVYRFRFRPLDYMFATTGDRRVQFCIQTSPGQYSMIYAWPVPPMPFAFYESYSHKIAPEVHSLAEFHAAKEPVWFLNKDEKSDAKLYYKAFNGTYSMYLFDPTLKSTLNVIAPLEGETVSGTITCIAAPTDGMPCQWMNLKVDGFSYYVDTLWRDAPYKTQIDTTKLSDGPHELEFVSTAAEHPGMTLSKKVTLTVDNTIPAVSLINKTFTREFGTGYGWPGILISGGSDVSFVAGRQNTVPVAAGVANMTASKVEFYVDAILKATDSAGIKDLSTETLLGAKNRTFQPGTPLPGATHFASIDYTTLTDGPHELTVKAYDAAGTLAASQTTKVSVYNKGAISLRAPLAGATVSGTVTALASVPDGIIPVRWIHFDVDGVDMGEDNLLRHEPPFGLCIDTTKLTDGPHVIEAKQAYSAGASDYLFSEKITFNVDNTIPAVFLTHQERFEAPWPGRMLSGTVPVAAGVANIKASKVEFSVDATVKETDSSSPYAASLDTTKLTEGAHELTVKAYDAAGKLAASETMKVSVYNKGAISILEPLAGKTVSGTVAAVASVPDGTPVRWMQFKVDGVEQGEDNLLGHAPPFGLCIDTAKLGDGPHEIEAVAGYGHLIGGWRVGATFQEYSPGTGKYLYSEKVAFTVDNTIPAVFLTHQERVEAPWPGRKISGTVPVEARVANLKAGKVEFHVDGALKGTDGSSLEEKRKAYLAQIDAAQRELHRPEAQSAWEQAGPWAGPWWSVGPYQAASAQEAFAKDYEPEHAVDLTKPTADGRVWVQHTEPEWRDGQPIWFVKLWGHPVNCAAYVYRVINARAATTLPLSLGSDETITVWVNGKQVLAHEVYNREAAADSEKLSIELRPGVNTLLMKIVNAANHSGFYFKAPLLEMPVEISTLLLLPAAQRSAAQREQVAAYYVSTAPALAGARRQLAALQQGLLAREKDPTLWPYGASIDTTKLTDGPHDLTVKAYDAAGKLAAAQTVKVGVANVAKDVGKSH